MSRTMARPPALIMAARHGLCPPHEPLHPERTEALRVLSLAQHDHLTGFLAAAVQAGEVIVDDEIADRINDAWHQELLACVVLEALAVRTGKTLEDAGVRWRLTKGAALAHLDYPDPSLRTFGDVDVITHSEDWSATLRALEGAGMHRDAESLGDRYDQRYGKGATLTSAEGLQVDLHRQLAIGRFGVTACMNDLFDGGDDITLAGRSIPVLTPECRLLHACYHASLGGFRRLRAFRDVAQLVLVTGVDWARTVEIARRWKAEAVVAGAIRETWEVFDLEDAEVHEWARACQVSWSDRRALKVFAEERPFSAQALTAVGRMPPSEVPRYLWVLARHRMGWLA